MVNRDRVHRSNGIITDYAYDMMSRLESLTNHRPDATPEDLSDNLLGRPANGPAGGRLGRLP
jgi:hypothetical protein